MSDQLRELVAAQERSLRRARKLLAVFAVAALLAVTFAYVTRAETWAPIGRLPEQQVLSAPGTIRTTVTVRGTKCFHEVPVAVRGVTVWRSVDPTGKVVRDREGARIFDPQHPLGHEEWERSDEGEWCVTAVYVNEIPTGVMDAARRGVKTWIVAGTMIPNDAHREGITRSWVSQPFTISP